MIPARLAAIALLTALTGGAPAGAQQPATPQPEFPMHFRIVEGQGQYGLTRWVQAEGSIMRNTGEVFEAFAREHDLRGMTIALHSVGGNIAGGAATAKRIRELGMNSTVARTYSDPDGAEGSAVLSGLIAECSSSCVYLFAGGVQRVINRYARLGLHQFRHIVGQPGEHSDDDSYLVLAMPAMEYGLFVELGIDPLILRFAASVPSSSMLHLNPAQISNLKLASVAEPHRDLPAPGRWLVSGGESPVMMYRAAHVRPDGQRLEGDIRLYCEGPKRQNHAASLVLVRTDESQAAPMTISTVEMTIGPWRAGIGRGLPMRATRGQDAFDAMEVPPEAIQAAAAGTPIALTYTIDGQGSEAMLATTGFEAAYRRFVSDCEQAAVATATETSATPEPARPAMGP